MTSLLCCVAVAATFAMDSCKSSWNPFAADSCNVGSPPGTNKAMPLSSIRLTQNTCDSKFTKEGQIIDKAAELALKPEAARRKALLGVTPVNVVMNDNALHGAISDEYEGMSKDKKHNKHRRALTDALKWLRQLQKVSPHVVIAFDHRRLALAALVRDFVTAKTEKLSDPEVTVKVLNSKHKEYRAFVQNELRKLTTEDEGKSMEMVNEKFQKVAHIYMAPTALEDKRARKLLESHASRCWRAILGLSC